MRVTGKHNSHKPIARAWLAGALLIINGLWGVPAELPEGVEAISYDSAENTIVLTFNLPSFGTQRHLYISGTVDGGHIFWSCHGDINQKYLPPMCRD